jgi:hypothetical protein
MDPSFAPKIAPKLIDKKWVQLTLALLAIAVCLALVVYTTYKTLKTSLSMVQVTQRGLIAGDGPGAIVRASSIPEAKNGAEFGYGVWVYVERAQRTTKPKQILNHERVRLTMGASDNTLSLEFQKKIGNTPSSTTWTGATLDYVPLARWVHIVSVYRDGTVTFFVDGDVSSVVRLDKPAASDLNREVPTGQMTVGGGGASFGTATWQGYIGSVTCLNYFPSAADVKKMYYTGPVGNGTMMKWIGMQGYGVRSPVYRLNGK